MMVKCNCNHCSAEIEFEPASADCIIACPACGMETTLHIPLPPPVLPPPPIVGKPVIRKRELTKDGCMAIACVIICVFVIAVIYALQEIGSDDKPRDEASLAYFAAYKFCERYVPSGKNFTTDSGGNMVDGRAEWMADQNNWYATGYVDAQNKFGAMRHQHWAAHVKLDSNWQLIYLDVGGETIIGGD